MLVLHRRVGEGIWIGEALVRFSGWRGSSVKVAIEAPRHVPIWRDELPAVAVTDPLAEVARLVGLADETPAEAVVAAVRKLVRQRMEAA